MLQKESERKKENFKSMKKSKKKGLNSVSQLIKSSERKSEKESKF